LDLERTASIEHSRKELEPALRAVHGLPRSASNVGPALATSPAPAPAPDDELQHESGMDGDSGPAMGSPGSARCGYDALPGSGAPLPGQPGPARHVRVVV